MENTEYIEEPTDDENKIESLIQSAFIQRLKDPFMGVFMEGRPPIRKMVGHAALVLSETEEGGQHLDLASSNSETLDGIQTALNQGIPIKPWVLEATDQRKLELTEAEHQKMSDAIARLKAKVDEVLIHEESGRGVTIAEIAAVRPGKYY